MLSPNYVAAQERIIAQDSVRTLWVADAIKLINNVLNSSSPGASDKSLIYEQKAIRCKIRNIGKLSRLIQRMNKLLAKKKITQGQYDHLIAQALGVDVVVIRAMR